MNPTTYRPDIDGLRTIAVGSVLLFHLGVPGFSGGFVGVDIFFVISGFLITQLIVREVQETGRLDLRRFYVRRVRRLAPALLFTIALVLAAAAVLFPQALMEETGKSAIYALLSISNFYFWREADYFDIEAIAKPLLHTWSLGVEEQFYAIWPLLLPFLLMFRSRGLIFAALLVIGLTSLALNLAFASGEVALLKLYAPKTAKLFADGKATIFYLPFFRLYEFAIGAALVWVLPMLPASRAIREVASIVGLIMIAIAVVEFSTRTMFPSYAALLPCLGAACLIYGAQTSTVGSLLRNRPAVWLGRVSYSLYLVHWPLIVFYAQYQFAPLDGIEMAALAAVSIVAAGLMQTYVEQPYRYPRRSGETPSDRRILWSCGTAAAVIAAFSASAVASNGWSWRIPELRLATTPKEQRAQENALCGDFESEPLFTCVADRGSKRDIHVWGDSHARHLIGGLTRAFPDHNIKILYESSCMPQSGLFGFHHDYDGRAALAESCVQRNRRALAHFMASDPTTILLHNFLRVGDAKNEALMKSTRSLLSSLQERGHTVRILSGVIRPAQTLSDCYSVPAIYSDKQLHQRCRGDERLLRELQHENEQLEAAFGSDVFLNLNAVFCDAGGCMAFVEGQPLFRDDHHLSIFGSQRFIEAARPRLGIQ